ncbi:MAG: hypothetical protein EOO11_19435 [Chitinophagaceae bacterium]|nr:MAG: hypothetical protein EOO11_19435 [Chitinophagaceae bacterium]
MRNWLRNNNRTTLAGYIVATLIAVEPLLAESVDWSSRPEVVRYGFRLTVAIAIAVGGKYAQDAQNNSHEEKTA